MECIDRGLHSPVAYELSKWMCDIKDTQRLKASKLLKLVNKYEDMHKKPTSRGYNSPPKPPLNLLRPYHNPPKNATGRPPSARPHKDMIMPMEESTIVVLNDSKTKVTKNNRGFVCKK